MPPFPSWPGPRARGAVLGTGAPAQPQTLGRPGRRRKSQGDPLPEGPGLPTRNAGLDPAEAPEQKRPEPTIHRPGKASHPLAYRGFSDPHAKGLPILRHRPIPLYRWLHQIEEGESSSTPANKTPAEIAYLVWEINKANFSWGRIRIANQLKLLGIFLSASTVRNILQRPPPNAPTSAATPQKTEEKPEARSVPAWYPNHVWSLDTTKVR